MEEAAMAGRGKHADSEGADAASGASRTRPKAIWVGVAAAAVVVLGALVWWLWPAQGVHVVTVLGVDYSTNMQVEEHGGYVYVTVPVNSEPGAVVVEVEDTGDSQEIRDFIDSLDTFTPGEHVLSLSDSNLHFIVDGMAE